MRMIQPINTTTPRVGFRASKKAFGKRTNGLTDSNVAMINAAGVAIAAGGLTSITARAYTRSWGNALILGLFGASLTMFFMAPHLISKLGLDKIGKKNKAEPALMQSTKKVAIAPKNNVRSAKKLLLFKSEQA